MGKKKSLKAYRLKAFYWIIGIHQITIAIGNAVHLSSDTRPTKKRKTGDRKGQNRQGQTRPHTQKAQFACPYPS